MEDVKWLEVTLDTTEAELDALCARLTGNGVTGLAIEDEEDFKTFLEQNHQYWDYVDDGLLARMKGVCRVKFYITDDADGRKQLEGWLAGIDQPYSLASLGDNDWAHSWQKYYKPMPVGGEASTSCPSGSGESPSRRGKRPCTSIPASPSAPGSHASTQLCLMGLERYTVPGKPVLDLGCGYGWHCIYAAEHGAAAVTGMDPVGKRCWPWPRGEDQASTGDLCPGRYGGDRPFRRRASMWSSVLWPSTTSPSFTDFLNRVRQCLVPGGDFVFSVEHPIFTAAGPQDWYYGPDGTPLHFPVDRYFEEGRRTARFLGEDVVKYHRTLTTYLDGLLTGGFELLRVVEPQPPAWMLDQPGMRDELRRPMMLLVAARRRPA